VCGPSDAIRLGFKGRAESPPPDTARPPQRSSLIAGVSPIDKSLLFLFFRKESAFFFVKKKQKTSVC
jgi:hypothetical protein